MATNGSILLSTEKAAWGLGANRAEVVAGVVSRAGTRLGGEAAAEVGPKQNQDLPALVCVS